VFVERLKRQAAALEALGEILQDGLIERLIAKAELDNILQSQPAAERSLRTDMRLLKAEYAFEMSDIDDTILQAIKIAAIENMLTERGASVGDLKIKLACGSSIVTPAGRTDRDRILPPFPTNGVTAQAGMPALTNPNSFQLYGQGHGGDRSPNGPGSGHQSAVLESFEDRIKRLEVGGAAAKLAAHPEQFSGLEVLAAIQEKQTDLLTQIALKGENSQRTPGSTIRVEPRVQWPALGDDGTGGTEVQDFYEKFEEVCGLPNNGKGMSDKEMLITLKNCLKGSRRKIYENILKSHRDECLMETDDGPGIMYKEVQARLMKFTATPAERHLRCKHEYATLDKGNLNALQFEAEWERVTAEMEKIGLGVAPLDKYYDYLVKVGHRMGEVIRLDRRPRLNKDNSETFRLCETWEEAHLVLLEHEGVRAGTKALSAARAAGQGALQTGYQDDGKGGGKGKKGKGGGKGKGRPICFSFRDTGTCPHGDNCKFSHDNPAPKAAAQAAADKAQKKAAAKEQRAAAQAQKKKADDELAAAALKGKGKGRKPEGKKLILCRHYKDHAKHGDCPLKGNCPYSHKAKSFDPTTFKYLGDGKGKGKGKNDGKKGKGKRQRGRGAAQELEEDDWGTPAGWNAGGGLQLIGAGPSGPRDSAVGPSQVITQGDGKEKAEVIHGFCGRQKGVVPEEKGGITSLSHLPEKCWKLADPDNSGIQFHTEVKIGTLDF